jgi:integrase
MIYEGQDPAIFNNTPDNDEQKHTFGSIFEEWMEKRIVPVCTPRYTAQVRAQMKRHILPFVGDVPISSVTSLELLKVLRQIEMRGTTDIAHRVKQTCGQVFRYGIAAGVCGSDPSAALQGAMKAHKVRHMAGIIDPRQVRTLLLSIDSYPATAVRCAMKFQALTFVRPGELRYAEWAEIDYEKAEWLIPEERMKKRRPHIVPLSVQALNALDEVRARTGHGRYIFPSSRTPAGNRPMSENAVLAALRSMGFEKSVMTGHGFRSTASTLLNANGWNRDVIERQLAHQESNTVRASYKFAEYLTERRRMMQWWADYLDGLRAMK